MRVVLVSVLLVVLCCAGYGVAFQTPTRIPSDKQGRSVESTQKTQSRPLRTTDPYSAVRIATATDEGSLSTPTLQPIADERTAPQSQQLAVLISDAGLRFLSQRAGYEIDAQADGIFVLCDSADVTTDAEGKSEVLCHAASVIKAAGMDGKASRLRYKSGFLVLEGDDVDSMIARNKGDKMVFMLRAKKISVNLTTQQIDASDGSMIQLRSPPKQSENENKE